MSKKNKKTVHVDFRCTEEDKQIFLQNAERDGFPNLSQYITYLLLTGVQKVNGVEDELEHINEVNIVLGEVELLLSQINRNQHDEELYQNLYKQLTKLYKLEAKKSKAILQNLKKGAK